MIKSIVQGDTFPKLMECEHYVILFTSPTEGTLVCIKSNSTVFKVGRVFTDIPKDGTYTDFNGSLILKNTL